jgi:hypothetical protein
MTADPGASVTPSAISQQDLDWWLSVAPTLEWTWAKTYATSAPHWYIVEGTTPDFSHEEFQRASRVIRAFGQPGRFYSSTNIYLTDPDTQRKWWSMDRHPDDGTLINMAIASNVYGEQDAPSTAPLAPAPLSDLYNSLGPDYDQMWLSPSDLQENEAVRKLILRHFGAYAPRTLDVGCGTGLLLDLGITAPGVYVGLDPSQGMLNELVLKHPRVSAASIIPADANTFDFHQIRPDPDLVTCLFGVASYLTPSTINTLADKARSLLVLMNYDGVWLPDYFHGVPPSTQDEARAAADDLLDSRGFTGYSLKIGAFEVTVVEK